MAGAASFSSSGSGRHGRFKDTLWSRIFRAGRLDGPEADSAWGQLCGSYWYPLYAFLRRSGHCPPDACDLTQGFLSYLFENNLVLKASPDDGRFRSFLLGTLKNYVSNAVGRAKAIKRGGRADIVSVDEQNAEGMYLNEPATDISPDTLYDRRWAIMVLQQAKERLRQEYLRNGLEDLFRCLEPHMAGASVVNLPNLAARLGRTENHVRVLLHRLNRRYGQLVERVIADTVATPELAALEFQHLKEILRAHA